MKKDLIGLDIGSHSIKAVQLKDTKKGFELSNFGVVYLPPEVIVEGEIMDANVIIDAIQQLIKENKIKTKNVATAVCGHSVIVKKIKLPKMSSTELEESIQWEAEQYIPFDIADVNLDFQIMHNIKEEDPNQMDVLLVAVKKEKVNDIINLVMGAGLIPNIIDVSAFALENQYEINYEVEPGQNIALVNMGAGVTNINILKDGETLFTRDTNLGGLNYTKTIQKEFNLDYEQAENIKMGKDQDGVDQESLKNIIATVSNELIMEVQRSFEYFRAAFENEKIDKMMFSGGCTNISGIQELFSSKLDVPVENMDPLKNISINEKKMDLEYLSHIAPSLAISVGLALRKVGDR